MRIASEVLLVKSIEAIVQRDVTDSTLAVKMRRCETLAVLNVL